MKPKLYYDFEHDLRKIILRGIKNYGIRSKITLEPDIIHLLAKWFEILDKLVESVPRSVHMSREIKTSLINLGISQREIEAKYMVSELCRKFKIGIDVTPWLSKKVLHDSTDQMLFSMDYIIFTYPVVSEKMVFLSDRIICYLHIFYHLMFIWLILNYTSIQADLDGLTKNFQKSCIKIGLNCSLKYQA